MCIIVGTSSTVMFFLFFLASVVSSTARSYNERTAIRFRPWTLTLTSTVPWTEDILVSPRGGGGDDDFPSILSPSFLDNNVGGRKTTTMFDGIDDDHPHEEEMNSIGGDHSDNADDNNNVTSSGNSLPTPRGGGAAFVGSGPRTTTGADQTTRTLPTREEGRMTLINAPATSTAELLSSSSSSSLSAVATKRTSNTEKSSIPSSSPRPPLKILFLSSDTGGGHRASAEALAVQFCHHFPGSCYELLDCWTDVESSWPYYTIKDTYKSFSATPWKWRALYHISNTAMYSRLADVHSYYMNEDTIRDAMEKVDPDVVVSVHPTMNYVPLLAVRKISKTKGRDIPFFTVVTDFGSGHRHWFNKDVDKMYLASEPIKQIAQKRGGVPDEKIAMIGLPIRHDFAIQAKAMGGDRTTEIGIAHRTMVRSSLGIDDPGRRMILVMGGGEGVGLLSDIVDELYAKLKTQGVNATICVVCGRNECLKADLATRNWDKVVSQSLRSYESLRSRFYTKVLSMHAHRSRRIQLALDRAAAKAAEGRDVADQPGDVKVIPLGFVTNMAEYMVAADVLVSKAGPGTIAESAAVGLPVMVTSYLPGQEAGNVDIVLNGGFGDFCEDPETIALEIACWLQESELLEKMSRKAMRVGYPNAAEEIALDIGEITQQWMKHNERNASAGGTDDGP